MFKECTLGSKSISRLFRLNREGRFLPEYRNMDRNSSLRNSSLGLPSGNLSSEGKMYYIHIFKPCTMHSL